MLRFLPMPTIALLALILGSSCAPDEGSSATSSERLETDSLPKAELELNIDIGDGSMVKAISVLRAAHELAVRQHATITFRHLHHEAQSIVVISQESMRDLPCDWMAIRLSVQGYELNGGLVSLDALRERLQRYSDTAKMVAATPILVVAADPFASGQELVAIFHELITAGVPSIIAAP